MNIQPAGTAKNRRNAKVDTAISIGGLQLQNHRKISLSATEYAVAIPDARWYIRKNAFLVNAPLAFTESRAELLSSLIPVCRSWHHRSILSFRIPETCKRYTPTLSHISNAVWGCSKICIGIDADDNPDSSFFSDFVADAAAEAFVPASLPKGCIFLGQLEQIVLDPTQQTEEHIQHLAQCGRCRAAYGAFTRNISHLDDAELLALLRGELPGMTTNSGPHCVAAEHLNRCRCCWERALSLQILEKLTLPSDSRDEPTFPDAPDDSIWKAEPYGFLREIGGVSAIDMAEAARFGDLPSNYCLTPKSADAEAEIDMLSSVAAPYLWLCFCRQARNGTATLVIREQYLSRWLRWAITYRAAEQSEKLPLSAVGRLAQYLIALSSSESTPSASTITP